MAGRSLLVLLGLAAFAATSQAISPVRKEMCQSLLTYLNGIQDYNSSPYCEVLPVLQQLECNCDYAVNERMRAEITPEMLGGFVLCDPSVTREAITVCPHTYSETEEMFDSQFWKKYQMPAIAGMMHVPGLGMIKQSSIQGAAEKPAPSKPILRPVVQPQPIQNEILEVQKPVLDLSALPFDMPLKVALGKTSLADISLTEVVNEYGDVNYSIDIGMPKEMLEQGTTLDLDISDLKDVDVDVSIEADFPMDVTYSTHDSFDAQVAGIVSEWTASVQSQAAEPKQNVALVAPEQTTARDSSFTDIYIDMEIDMTRDNSVQDASITVHDDSINFPVTGADMGQLLTGLSALLATQSMPQDILTATPESEQIHGALRGVSKLLMDVGGQVSEIIPEQQFYDGQTLEITAEERLAGAEATSHEHQIHHCKMMAALSEALRSVNFFHASEDKALDDATCSICTIVHKYLPIFWATIFLGAVYITYTLLSAWYKASTSGSTETASSDKENELKQPLIINAADFVDSHGGKISSWSPYCGPMKPL